MAKCSTRVQKSRCRSPHRRLRSLSMSRGQHSASQPPAGQPTRGSTSVAKGWEPQPPVYLLHEKTHGKAAAGLESNQTHFMRLMGLIEQESEFSGIACECHISDELLEILMTASRHRFSENIRREGHNDSLIFEENVDMALGVSAEQVPQCNCSAHTRLSQPDLPENEREDLKVIVRSAYLLTADAGCNYACALLRILFMHMGMPQFKAERSGHDFGVSYTLLCEQKKYSFRGYPDFIVHKDDIGAGRILVATGEMNNPAVIYGVGSLLSSISNRPILCLTIFKNKTAQLSVARLRPVAHEDEAVVGAVSLKYIESPSPMDLKTTQGIKSLASRFYHMLMTE